MLYNRIYIEYPVAYHSTGTFQAPSSNWIHEKRMMRNFELIIMMSGTLYMEINSIRYCVKPNQCLLIQPMSNDNTKPYSCMEGYRPGDCSYYWLHFNCQPHSFCTYPADGFIPTNHQLYIPTQMTLTNPARVFQYLRQLQDCMKTQYSNFIDFGNYLSTLILCEIYHQFLDSYNSNGDSISSKGKNGNNKNQSIYYNLMDYINTNLSHKLQIDELANHFGYSSKYLSALCKTHTGFSLKKYIQKKKIDRANFLLLDTNMTIQQIGYEVGFDNNHNFSRAYKNYMGISPMEYKNTYSKKINN